MQSAHLEIVETYAAAPIPFDPEARRATLREEEEFADIWPSGPLAIDAYDLADLSDPSALEVVSCLLTLGVERDRQELVILNLDHLVLGNPDTAAITRMYQLKALLVSACRKQNMPSPRILLERSDGRLDLRVFLRKSPPAVCNVVPFPKAAEHAPAA